MGFLSKKKRALAATSKQCPNSWHESRLEIIGKFPNLAGSGVAVIRGKIGNERSSHRCRADRLFGKIPEPPCGQSTPGFLVLEPQSPIFALHRSWCLQFMTFSVWGGSSQLRRKRPRWGSGPMSQRPSYQTRKRRIYVFRTGRVLLLI